MAKADRRRSIEASTPPQPSVEADGQENAISPNEMMRLRWEASQWAGEKIFANIQAEENELPPAPTPATLADQLSRLASDWRAGIKTRSEFDHRAGNYIQRAHEAGAFNSGAWQGLAVEIHGIRQPPSVFGRTQAWFAKERGMALEPVTANVLDRLADAFRTIPSDEEDMAKKKPTITDHGISDDYKIQAAREIIEGLVNEQDRSMQQSVEKLRRKYPDYDKRVAALNADPAYVKALEDWRRNPSYETNQESATLRYELERKHRIPQEDLETPDDAMELLKWISRKRISALMWNNSVQGKAELLVGFAKDARRHALRLRTASPSLPTLPSPHDDGDIHLMAIEEWCINARAVATAEWIKMADAAKILGVADWKINRWASDGTLVDNGEKNQKRRVTRESVERAKRNGEQPPTSPAPTEEWKCSTCGKVQKPTKSERCIDPNCTGEIGRVAQVTPATLRKNRK